MPIKKKQFKKIDEFGFDQFGRPCLDLYCMNLAFEIARKSLDPNTKHGCIAIAPDGDFISAGYNSPPQASDDANIPINRPDKYIYFEHAEKNCIFMAGRKGVPLKGSYFYITGFPCSDCIRAMIQVGVLRIIYGPYNSVMTNDEEYMKRYPILLKNQSIVVERFRYDKGLYQFNPRIKQIIEERHIEEIDFEWNRYQIKKQE